MKTPFMSIAAQAAQVLRNEIAGGTWVNSLPGERQLAARLQISRRTLRSALAELRSDGTLATHPGHASVITRRQPPRATAADRRIVLLLPEPLESLRPFTVLWVNRLTALLQDNGYRLEVVHGGKYYGANPARSLALVTAAQPARCWILARSHRPLQEWFAAAGLPALVCGSTHPGISLPSVDIDHRAECRHVVGVFRRYGHRHLALFLERAGLAGDAESEAGFREGAAQSDAQPTIVRCDRSVPSVKRALRTLLALPEPPTAMLVSNSYTYLTVLSLLGSMGRRVPQDISIVSRDEEPFLRFLYPDPARYSAQPAKFAAALNRALKQIIAGRGRDLAIRIMPEFVPGESVGRTPEAPA